MALWILAIIGWLFFIVSFSLLMVVAMTFGAQQELMKQQAQDILNPKKGTRTNAWTFSPYNEKEIPFGD